MKDFTAGELATFDGRDGLGVYVAYEGVIYDVSDSGMWSGGDHEGAHQAGHDLTAEHGDAPHEVYVTDFPAVGRLV